MCLFIGWKVNLNKYLDICVDIYRYLYVLSVLCNVKWPFIQRISFFYLALLPGRWGLGLERAARRFLWATARLSEPRRGCRHVSDVWWKYVTWKCPPTQLGHYQWIICSRPSIQIKYNVSLSENLHRIEIVSCPVHTGNGIDKDHWRSLLWKLPLLFLTPSNCQTSRTCLRGWRGSDSEYNCALCGQSRSHYGSD